MDGLAHRTIKNSAYGFVGYAWPILFSIFITPVVVYKLGVAEYGIYVLVNTIIAFLSLLDLGLSVALIKYIAEYAGQNNYELLRKLLNSANSLYLIIGVFGFLVFCAIGIFFLPLFNIPAQSQGDILTVFLLAGLIFFVNAISSVYTIAPNALQRFDISTKINLFQLTFLNLSVLCAVLLGYQLKAIFALNLLSVIVLISAYRFYFPKLLPQIRLGYSWASEEIKKAYKFGVFAALTNFSSTALIQLDRLIIPIFTGPASLTYYSLPGNVAQKTSGIVGSLAGIFFPLVSAVSGAGEYEKLKIIYKRAFRNIAVIAAAFTCAISCFAYQILYFWLGKEFADKGTIILVILAFTYFFLAIYGPLTSFLLGMGKVKFLCGFSFFLAFLNLLFLLVLVPKYGIIGAAWAYLLSVLPVLFAFYFTEQKYLRLERMGNFYLKLYAKIAAVSLAFCLLAKFILLKGAVNLWSLLVIGPLSIILYFTLYKLFGFIEEEDWELFKDFGRQILNKIRGKTIQT